jgi:DNA-binding NarL/FixJ family response regulator
MNTHTENFNEDQYPIRDAGSLVWYHLYNSTGSTSTAFTTNDGSTSYTIEGNLKRGNTVSKSINIKKDVQMTIDDRPTHLYFDRDPCKLKITPEIQKHLDAQPRKIVICKKWSDLPSLLDNSVYSICFAESELKYSSAVEIVNMVNTMSKLVNLMHTVTVTMAITKDTRYETIKLLQKSNIFGIIPVHTDFGLDEATKGCAAQWANIPYWPKQILDKLSGSKRTTDIAKPGQIKLTQRQQQILDLIRERGASNKVIAKTLNISESTVKLHVGIVLKKFNVKNRTQLALFSKK